MKLVLLLVACLIAAVFAAPLTSRQYELVYTKFVEQHNKQYEVGEFFQRFSIFRSNLDLILAHNAQNLPWTMALNQFADMTPQEFESMMGLKEATALPEEVYIETENSQLPGLEASIDWVAKGKVNKVKNQGQCGSCWSFSGISVFESMIAIKTGKLSTLSEQQQVDCNHGYGSNGCSGGTMASVYQYLMKSKGACTEAAYPYTGKNGSCKDSKCSGPKPTGFDMIAKTDAAHINALQRGPVAVALAASSSNFQFYSSGILTVCPDRNVNHAVVMVGYGTQNGVNYYNVRNSWGPTWGASGYIKIAAGKGLCGLATASFDVQPRV